MVKDELNELYNKATSTYDLALGYPVNREHAFIVNLEELGFIKNSFASSYLNNIGSPYTNGKYIADNVKELEIKLMCLLAKHFNLEVSNSFGYVTSGGTEANFVAIWWHRELLTKTFNKKPIIIGSSRSHYSLRKISNQLGIQLIEIPSSYAGININTFESTLKSITSPVIFWGNFGSTTDGAIDDIVGVKRLLDIYLPNRYKIHGDGAIYGLFIPYIPQFKNISCIFNYVDTLSMSGHKFLGSYLISGIVLTQKHYLEQVFCHENRAVSYLQQVSDITASGSRSGLAVVELYLLILEAFKCNSNGTSNLFIKWNDCLIRAKWFYCQLLSIIGSENKNLYYNEYQLSLIIPSPQCIHNKDYIAEKYRLMTIGDSSLGIFVLPRSTKPKLEQFLQDYSACGSWVET